MIKITTVAIVLLVGFGALMEMRSGAWRDVEDNTTIYIPVRENGEPYLVYEEVLWKK